MGIHRSPRKGSVMWKMRPCHNVTLHCALKVPPYIMEPSPENANVTAGDRHCGHTHGDYVGFLIDLLDAIGKELNVRYEITLSNEYGSQLGDQWSGMIGEVVRGVSRDNEHLSSNLYSTLSISHNIFSPSNSQKTSHSSPVLASYGVSVVSS